MIAVNLSAGAIFGLGVFTGVILTTVGIVVIAIVSSKKSKNK